MKTIQLLAIMTVLGTSGPAQSQEITDPDARSQKIEALLHAVGGQEVWANAAGFHMLEIAHIASIDLPLVREFWVDFETPRIKMVSRGQDRDQVSTLNDMMGWSRNKDSIYTWEDNQVKGWRSFWPGIPTRVFHLIASNDPSLSYKVFPDRIDFFVNDQFAVWIATSPDGLPVAYGREQAHTETHFLGEIRPYGPVKLWDTAHEPGGQWSVLMVDYELLDDLSGLSYEPPEGHRTN